MSASDTAGQAPGPAPGLTARTEAILRAWDALAEHRTASAGDAATAEWLAGEVRRRGFEPALDAFALERCTPAGCHLVAGDTRIDGIPCFDGGETRPEGITGAIGPLGSGAPIGLMRVWPEPAHPSIAALREARARAAHGAIVAVAAGESVAPGPALVNADAFARPGGCPVLQVDTAYGARLDAAAAAGAQVRILVRMDREPAEATNVTVRVAGSHTALAPLVVMTPRSGWWRCTAERGGGIVVWLEALARLAGQAPARDVVFSANSGHELGHLGLAQLISREPGLVAAAHAWVHLGANFAARGARIRWQASDEALLALGERLRPDTVTPPGERPQGEARNVFDGGGRFVSLLGTNALFHHPDDRWPQAVDVTATARLTAPMVEIVEALARA